MRARTARTSLALVAATALLAACGSTSSGGKPANAASQTPAAELASAVHALGAAHTLTFTLSLGASGADLLQIASGLGGDGPTKAQADAIGGDHIGFELQAPTGQTIADGDWGSGRSGGAVALTLGDDSTDFFNVESVAGALFGRIDLRYFLGLINGAPSFGALQRQVSEAPAFVRDALAGKWVSVPAATLKSLAGLAGGQLGATAPSSPLLAARSKLLPTLLADLDVTRSSTGGADDLDVTFRLRKLITDEYAVLAPAVGAAIPRGADGGSPLPGLNPRNIPDVTVHLDAFVTDGALSKVVFDAGQFDTAEHISVPIDLDISRSGPTIAAPGGATPIDLSMFSQLFPNT